MKRLSKTILAYWRTAKKLMGALDIEFSPNTAHAGLATHWLISAILTEADIAQENGTRTALAISAKKAAQLAAFGDIRFAKISAYRLIWNEQLASVEGLVNGPFARF